MDAAGNERLHVHISGLVQGVGFRHATLAQARSHGLTGWVRNLPDGRVEAAFEGDRPTLDQMLEWCHEGPHLSDVRRVESVREQATGEFPTFQITF